MGNEIKVGIGAKLESSFKSTVQQVKQSARDVAKEAGMIVAETAKAEVKHRALHAFVSSSFSVLGFLARRGLATVLPTIASILGGLSLIGGSVKILSGLMALFERATGAANTGLSKMGQTEELISRLKRLSGSAEAAKIKLAELAKTYTGTNVGMPEAVDAYKNSEVMMGGAMSSNRGMTMLGDVAAASGNGLKETSGAIGKFYDDLQAGRPIEEAASKLQDMGIITADVHSKITAMLNEGKSGVEVWDMLVQTFQRSSGAMAQARDNLDSLQKGLAQAKDKLYQLFAEDSLDEAKNRLKAQTKAVEDLGPAAKEAGGLFAELKSIIGDTTTTLNNLYDWVLKNVGSLKGWVDVLFVAVLALGGFAVGAIAGALALGTLAAGALAAAGAVVAAVAAIAAGVLVWSHHQDELLKHQQELIRGTHELLTSLKNERDAIGSVADKAKAMAKAYEALKRAREDLANAKTPEDREEYRKRVGVVERAVTRLGRIDDSTLEGSEPRKKSEQTLSDMQGKDAFSNMTDTGKLAALQSTLEAAATKREELRKKWEAAYNDTTPEGMADLDMQIADARRTNTPDSLKEASALEARKFGATQANETAHTAVAAQDVEVEKAYEAFEQQRKLNEEKERGRQTRIAELEVEQRIARLQSEGITRARQEWQERRAGLVAQFGVAQLQRDPVKMEEAYTHIQQGDAQMAQQERAAARQEREIAAEMKLASLQGEGVERAREESEIRLGLIESRWKEAIAAQDAVEIDRQRLAYYQEQIRSGKEVEGILNRQKEAARELAAVREERGENAMKRAADAALAAGRITPEQRRALDIDLLKKKQREAYDEARKMDEDAARERAAGHADRADRLTIDAEKKREQGDTFGFDAAALGAKPDAGRPVADSLARLGLGGNVAPTTQDPMKNIAERQARATESVLTVLKEIRDKNRTAAPSPGVFGQ